MHLQSFKSAALRIDTAVQVAKLLRIHNIVLPFETRDSKRDFCALARYVL
jgi:hypothetical protein